MTLHVWVLECQTCWRCWAVSVRSPSDPDAGADLLADCPGRRPECVDAEVRAYYWGPEWPDEEQAHGPLLTSPTDVPSDPTCEVAATSYNAQRHGSNRGAATKRAQHGSLGLSQP